MYKVHYRLPVSPTNKQNSQIPVNLNKTRFRFSFAFSFFPFCQQLTRGNGRLCIRFRIYVGPTHRYLQIPFRHTYSNRSKRYWSIRIRFDRKIIIKFDWTKNVFLDKYPELIPNLFKHRNCRKYWVKRGRQKDWAEHTANQPDELQNISIIPFVQCIHSIEQRRQVDGMFNLFTSIAVNRKISSAYYGVSTRESLLQLPLVLWSSGAEKNNKIVLST